MKKVLFIFVAMFLLAGCSDKIDFASLDGHVEKLKVTTQNFATGSGDIDQLSAEIEAFNKELNKIQSDDKKVKEYIKMQLEANKLRFEGLSKMDSEKISKSSQLQYNASGLLKEIKK